MRIIAGEFRSRLLKSLPGDSTRPTADRVREAVFSKLGTYFDKGFILDLFAGSGAVALEAISRGYDKAVAVDKNIHACRIIRENAESLKVSERVDIWNMDCYSAIARIKQKADLIYIDPPYDWANAAEILAMISKYDILADTGTIVLETHKNSEFDVDKPLHVEKSAAYGISKVTYIRKEQL